MTKPSDILGIDIGSVSVSAVSINIKKEIGFTATACHHGNIKEGLKTVLSGMDMQTVLQVAVTSSTPSSIIRDHEYDDQLSLIRAATHFHRKIGSILNVGGEKFSLSLFDEHMNYLGSKNNTSCAAGTGSFLDQQSSRLGLFSPGALSDAASANKSNIPDIATRCAVFAKTDLIHAQQEGFSVPQICDGLCMGLARNIYNTLFTEKDTRTPVIFCGGVSRNQSVTKHLESLIKAPLICDSHSHLYGAAGAALCMVDDIENDAFESAGAGRFITMDDLYVEKKKSNVFFFPELKLELSEYPEFLSFDNFIFEDVENDIYVDPASIDPCGAFLGIDVGSTSTKGIIISENGEVLAGFYTRTASRPVNAVQCILKSADMFINKHNLDINIRGCGTTGSGRKISAGIIGADLVLDEITAHSRAAFELDNDVDTIIEIGGQDAKFTTMKNGVVTSSFMNTVCAAGTGSFIEEQALKLGCPLDEYSKRTEGLRSPVSSDRCTVFMERDINHFLSEGYTVDEVLSSALHSVRDNYMTKVATEGKMGKKILFQGATAKNKALIAAFEHRLKAPIHVSKYCHLTGALGVALTLKDQEHARSKFKGFDLWKSDIPVRLETCKLCTNHCKLTIAEMGGETVAFGFLCGRDYETNHYVPKEKNFQLLEARKEGITLPHPGKTDSRITIGIPAALHLVEDLNFWKVFFSYLGIKTIDSAKMKSPVTLGRALAGAEFCTPVTSLHGHVDYLMEKADYVFLPYYFENRSKDKKIRRQYCYYTQYAPSVITGSGSWEKHRLISPLVKDIHTVFYTRIELYRSLKKIPELSISFIDIVSAFDKTLEWQKQARKELKAIFNSQRKAAGDIDVILVGRPYTILSESLNSKIPDIFANLKVNAFFQDMIDLENHDCGDIEPLLNEIHWEHAATILKASLVAARTPGLFPVYITSFKCAPDSFAVDYFKKIMEAHDKPYLVLELDEHDSSVGYETRIEAAVRAFRNHIALPNTSKNLTPGALERINPSLDKILSDKIIIMPNWDPITGEFLAATLRGEGFETILMEETHETIKKSLQTNTGQCIPLNAIASGFAQTIINHDIAPERAVLWMSRSDIACNIKMYPHHIKTILTQMGSGFENAGVYRGDLSFNEVSMRAATNAYFSYMFGGLLRNLGCRIRPYEVTKGETDQALCRATKLLSSAFEGKCTKENALKEALARFEEIKTDKNSQRPRVGIFGDFYVRDNDIMNQDLIHFIEAHGGEAVTTPYYRFAKMIADSYFKKWFKEGKYFNLLAYKALITVMSQMEKRYYKYFEPLFKEPDYKYTDSFKEILSRYDILPEHTGESMDNILKIHYTLKAHPDLSLFVQTSPSFCCPGLVTEAMAGKIEKKTGVPIVSITYDALGGNKNRVIIPYLQYARKHHFQTLKKRV